MIFISEVNPRRIHYCSSGRLSEKMTNPIKDQLSTPIPRHTAYDCITHHTVWRRIQGQCYLMGNLLDNRWRYKQSDQMTSWRHFTSWCSTAEKIVYIFQQDLSKRKHCLYRRPADFSYRWDMENIMVYGLMKSYQNKWVILGQEITEFNLRK
jgi:hypothetical protein